MNQNFSEREARAKVGKRVRSLAEFSGVPVGTQGTIIKTHKERRDCWTVAIQWKLPTQKRSVIFSMVGDVSVNYVKTGKPNLVWFGKEEYERSLVEE